MGVLIVRVDPEELVLDECAAHGKAVDLAQILGLDVLRDILTCAGAEEGHGGVIVVGVPVALAIPEVSLAVDLIGAALGDRGDDASGSTAVLSRVDAGVDREFTYSAAGSGIGFAGAAALLRIVGVVIVCAVDLNVVQHGADTTDADQAEAAGVRYDAGGGHG